MIAPYGFDLSAFVRPQQSESPLDAAIAGQQMASQGQNRFVDMLNAIRHQQTQREQMQNAAEMNDEQIRQRMDEATLEQYGQDARKQAELAAAAKKFALEQAMKQREIEGGLVGDATKAFSIGDQAGIQAAQARAGVQAPNLQFQRSIMPGLNPMGIADPWAEATPGLNITRGDETLYSGSTAEQRRMQQETARAALDPSLGGSESSSYAPFVAAGIGLAGLGMSGADAAKLALEQGAKAAARDASRENARQISMSRNDTAARGFDAANRDRWNDLDAKVTALANDKNRMDAVNAARAAIQNADNVTQMIQSGNAVAQNWGDLQVLKGFVKGAASDRDMRNIQGADGLLSQVEKDINYVIGHKEMPAGMAERMSQALQLVKKHNELVMHRAGIEARDQVYLQPGIVAQTLSPYELAGYGLQAYHKLNSTEPLTEEDISHEAKRITPHFQTMKSQLAQPTMPVTGSRGAGGGGGGSVSIRGDIVPQDLGGLGVAPLPPKPNPNRQRAMELLRKHAGQ